VSQYYKNIYSKGQVNDYPAINNIEGFLGEDVLNRPEVQNAKLSEAEKIELDAPLTLKELTKSINKANIKSAPGSNGISNKFIKRYWDFLKHPLLKYANFAYTSGRLTNSFRTANTKLIPKKGADLKILKKLKIGDQFPC
jgi:hypothetical protein